MSTSAQRSLLGSILVETVDTTPFTAALSAEIVTALQKAGFSAYDNGHHIAVATTFSNANFAEWECAVIYLSDERTLWIKVIAQRWWLLFTAGDRRQRYEALWEAIDTLQPVFDQFASDGRIVHQGTVGELNLAQAFEDANGRKPSPSELAALEIEIEQLSNAL